MRTMIDDRGGDEEDHNCEVFLLLRRRRRPTTVHLLLEVEATKREYIYLYIADCVDE